MIGSNLCLALVALFCVSCAAEAATRRSSTVHVHATPAYDCRKPQRAVAKTICESPEYRAMDREIAALTDRAKAELTEGEQSQLVASTARFTRQRAGCEWAAHNSAHPGTAIDECVRASLEERVRRLRSVVARSGT